MAEIRHMTSAQFRRAKRLIRRLCANYNGGFCLLLEENFEPCPCPQLLTYSLLCKYFRAAVLPADAELHREIMGSSQHKRCAVCGRPFYAKSNRALYCDRCADLERRRKTRDRVRRHRGSA